jgi:hypothetical protein
VLPGLVQSAPLLFITGLFSGTKASADGVERSNRTLIPYGGVPYGAVCDICSNLHMA